jgi:hypothetical protein
MRFQPLSQIGWGVLIADIPEEADIFLSKMTDDSPDIGRSFFF